MDVFRDHANPTRGATTSARGFTLLELVIVIALIVLLVAILLPALSQARRAAVASQCLGNFRQLGTLAHIYVFEYDQYMFASDWDPDPANKLSWQVGLYSESGGVNADLFQCPAIESGRRFDPSGSASAGLPDLKTACYIMNIMRPGTNGHTNWSGSVIGGLQISTDPKKSRGWTGVEATTSATASAYIPLRTLQVTKPLDKTILLTDHRWDWSLSAGTMTSGMADGIYRFGATDWAEKRIESVAASPRMKVGYNHSETFNVLYGDGHAERTSQTEPDDWVVASDY